MTTSTTSKTPENLTIIPRKVDFDIQSSLKKNPYFIDNDPVTSHFLSAIQSLFPEGERFFIDAARDVRNQYVKKHGENSLSPELEKQIKLFIRQEAHHGVHHDKWNQALVGNGYEFIGEMNDDFCNSRKRLRKILPPIIRLGLTVAGEHFTAVSARLELHKDTRFFEKMDRPFHDLIVYHAVEEIEHKSVCFDLFKHVGGGYLNRIIQLVAFNSAIIFALNRIHIQMLKKDGVWNKETKKKRKELLWGKQGFYRQLIPDMLDYLRPSFHPWDDDDRTWLKKDYSETLKEYDIELPAY